MRELHPNAEDGRLQACKRGRTGRPPFPSGGAHCRKNREAVPVHSLGSRYSAHTRKTVLRDARTRKEFHSCNAAVVRPRQGRRGFDRPEPGVRGVPRPPGCGVLRLRRKRPMQTKFESCRERPPWRSVARRNSRNATEGVPYRCLSPALRSLCLCGEIIF